MERMEAAKIYGARVLATARAKKHIDLSKKVGADNVIPYQENEEQFLKNLNMRREAFFTVQLSLHRLTRS
jgi:NADPH:quinone reductase-like Zn-dependent oxidoreductase